MRFTVSANDSQCLHLHIDNASALGDVFEITQSRLDDALSRHPQIADKLRVTMASDGAGFAEAMQTAEALFAWTFPTNNLALNAPNLRLLQIQGAGINHLLPLDWVPDNVVLTNSSGAHGARASEYLMMAILALNNGIPAMMTAQRAHQWRPRNNTAIEGKTLLIYGVGAIGGSCATQAKKFGLQVLGIRRSADPHASVDEMHSPEKLHALIPRADFIIMCAPHTVDTDKVFGRAEFALMKEGAGFVSYSRAGLTDYEAMRDVLINDKISAVVDVFDEEPLPSTSPLWDTPNLMITPHSSSNDPLHHAPRSLDLLFANLERYLSGLALLNVVDTARQY